jgi:hypothetical protein
MKTRNEKIRTGWAFLSLIGAIALPSACASDFESCAATRSCGDGAAGEDHDDESAGSGGEDAGAGAAGGDGGGSDRGASGAPGAPGAPGAGAGGASGSEVEPLPCTESSECDDGLGCNGVEQCVNDECAPGEAPCENANPEHCDSVCAESAEGPECGHAARDADGDGHGDAACAESPGDDCDDSPVGGASVHPGADEVCNELIDDDCDGIDESTDEVLLAGETGTVVAASGIRRDNVSIAASADGGFGVVWADWRAELTSLVYYVSLSADGLLGNETLVESTLSYRDQNHPDIADFGAGKFRVVMSAQAAGTQLFRAANVTYDGSAVSDKSTPGDDVSGEAQIAPTGRVYYRGIEEPVPAEAASFHVAQNADRYVYEDDGALYLGDNGEDGVEYDYPDSETMTYPVIDGVESNSVPWSWALAYRFDDAGIRIGSCEFPDGIPIDMARLGSGHYALTYWNADQTALYVRVVFGDCSFSPSALVVQEDGSSIGSAAISADKDDNIVVVWSSKDTESSEWSIRYRMFGPALCE